MIDRAPRRVLRESALVCCLNLITCTPGILASMPAPTDSRAIVATGPDPHHLLFLGSGVVSGFGLASHALGAGCHLARFISAETGRGVGVDIVPIPSLLLRILPAHLSRLELGGYDAVILAVGVNDAFGITSRRAWLRGLADALRVLKERLPPGGQIFLLAIADPTPSPVFRRRASHRASARASEFNDASRQLVEGDPDVTVIGFTIGPTTDMRRTYDSTSYLGWARQMGPRVVEGLARIRPDR